MKKTGALLIFLFLLISLIAVQEARETTGQSDIDGAIGPLDESLDKVELEKVDEFKEKTDAIAEKPIPIPEPIQPLAKIFFGLEDDSSLSLFIITLAIWLLFALSFSNIMELFSTFSKGVAIAIGFILTIILAATGAIGSMAVFLTNTASGFKFLETWTAGALGFWILVILIIWLILHKITDQAKEYQLLRHARREGIEAGADLATVKWIKKVFGMFGSKSE